MTNVSIDPGGTFKAVDRKVQSDRLSRDMEYDFILRLDSILLALDFGF